MTESPTGQGRGSRLSVGSLTLLLPGWGACREGLQGAQLYFADLHPCPPSTVPCLRPTHRHATHLGLCLAHFQKGVGSMEEEPHGCRVPTKRGGQAPWRAHGYYKPGGKEGHMCCATLSSNPVGQEVLKQDRFCTDGTASQPSALPSMPLPSHATQAGQVVANPLAGSVVF